MKRSLKTETVGRPRPPQPQMEFFNSESVDTGRETLPTLPPTLMVGGFRRMSWHTLWDSYIIDIPETSRTRHRV